ncbi:MAG: dihydroorotase [Verrucomicrobiales bacterium]|nr:dihydroorotase [Verrucomicrobiales bacterium]
MARLFKNGKIARADSADFRTADVLVNNKGVIESLGASLSVSEQVEIIDCEGCLLVPGMFDLNVHGREPGEEHAETLASCAEAAIHGGVTGLVLMPDTTPPVDSGNLVKSLQDLVSEVGSIRMLPAGCLTKGQKGERLAGFSGMVSRGIPMLTDSGNSVPCPDLLRRCMEYARDFDVLVATSCDTAALSKAGAVNEGKVSYRLGLPGIPAMSQEIAIDRNIRVAQHTGARLHLQQISTENAVKSVASAKEAGTKLSCEVSAHHLLLTEEQVVDYNTHFKLSPPLRIESDRAALVAGLIDGTVDVIASNHSPHSDFEKSADFGSAPFGVTGLETTVLAIYDGLIKPGVFGWDLLIERYSKRPREIIGLDPVAIEEGARAEFFVFDPNAETEMKRDYFKTKSPVTPFLDKTLAGAIRQTVV